MEDVLSLYLQHIKMDANKGLVLSAVKVNKGPLHYFRIYCIRTSHIRWDLTANTQSPRCHVLHTERHWPVLPISSVLSLFALSL